MYSSYSKMVYNKLKTFQKFQNSYYKLKNIKPKVLGIGLSLSVLFTHHHFYNNNFKIYQFDNNKPKKTLQKDLISYKELVVLNKESYINTILGNKQDHYFLIVVEDEQDQDILRETVKASKSIQDELFMKTQEENSQLTLEQFKNIKYYIVNRKVLQDVQNLVNRVKEFKSLNTYNDKNPGKIEIYFKTPISHEYVYFHYESATIFSSEIKMRKLSSRIIKFMNFIQTPQTSQELLRILQSGYNDFQAPVIIQCVPQKYQKNKKAEKFINRFKKDIFFCMERKIISQKSQIIIIDNNNLKKKYNLKEYETYILRNDLAQKLQILHGDQSQNNDYINLLETLTSFKNANNKLMNNIKNSAPLDYTEKQKQKDSDKALFINYVLPNIVLLKNQKYSSLGQLFKKISFQKDKYVLSLVVNEEDTKNTQRLKTFTKLYQKYKDQFIFIVIQGNVLEDLFPHTNQLYPRFSLFNFFNQDKKSIMYGNYFKHLIYPSEKYQLVDNFNILETEEQLNTQIQQFLQNPKEFKQNQYYNTTINDAAQYISGKNLENLLQQSQNNNENAIIFMLNEKQELSDFKLRQYLQFTTQNNEQFQNSNIKTKFYYTNTHQEQNELFLLMQLMAKNNNQNQIQIQNINQDNNNFDIIAIKPKEKQIIGLNLDLPNQISDENAINITQVIQQNIHKNILEVLNFDGLPTLDESQQFLGNLVTQYQFKRVNNIIQDQLIYLQEKEYQRQQTIKINKAIKEEQRKQEEIQKKILLEKQEQLRQQELERQKLELEQQLQKKKEQQEYIKRKKEEEQQRQQQLLIQQQKLKEQQQQQENQRLIELQKKKMHELARQQQINLIKQEGLEISITEPQKSNKKQDYSQFSSKNTQNQQQNENENIQQENNDNPNIIQELLQEDEIDINNNNNNNYDKNQN